MVVGTGRSTVFTGLAGGGVGTTDSVVESITSDGDDTELAASVDGAALGVPAVGIESEHAAAVADARQMSMTIRPTARYMRLPPEFGRSLP